MRALGAFLSDMPVVLMALACACILPELVLSGADYGLWGRQIWRGLAYAYGGFWPGLLHDWRPNYAGQPWTMFVTYGFLHSGPVHLIVNMISLVSLGRGVIDRVGTRGFGLIYGAALLGGGLAFALLANATNPMVGASGALFGLAGALVALAWAERRAAHETLWPVLRVILWLVGLNVVLWVATAGLLAWATHLGGFLAGAAMGWGLERRMPGPA
jgi:rhomboid protease GluP